MNLEDALSGTYKGVPFLMVSGTVSGGNKNVIHGYPNSNRQTVENLGQTPRSFPVSILLPSRDYATKRDALLAAFEDGKPGPLVHPLHGRVENVIAGPYTLTEDFTALGSGTISVTFFIHNGPGVPQAAGVTVSSVAGANNALSAALQANLSGSFNVTPSFLGSFEAATAAVQDAATAFQDSLAPLDQASEYLAAAEALSSEVAALIMSPVNLALRVTAMFERATTLFDDPTNALRHFAGFFGFGGAETKTLPVTAAQIEARQNESVFNLTMNAHALGYSYLSAVQTDYPTVDDVEQVAALLDAQFKEVSNSAALGSVAYEALVDLRQLAVQLLDEIKLTARRVVTVRTPPTTARLLAFTYYGDDAQGTTIADLNNGNVSNLRGHVKVITE